MNFKRSLRQAVLDCKISLQLVLFARCPRPVLGVLACLSAQHRFTQWRRLCSFDGFANLIRGSGSPIWLAIIGWAGAAYVRKRAGSALRRWRPSEMSAAPKSIAQIG